MNKSKLIIALSAILILAIIPVISPSPFFIFLLISIYLLGSVCESWDLSMGYLGLFNFGHLAFFAMGGYISGILSLYYGINPWLTIIISAATTCVLGYLLSLVTLRASHFAFSLIAFAFQSMFLFWIRSGGGPAPGGLGGTLTGGTQGLGALIPIPPLNIGSVSINAFGNSVSAYYLTLILFIGSTLAMYMLVNSRFGLAAVALRDSRNYAISRGINPLTYTSLFISFSTLFAGLAGAFYAHLFGVVSPEIIGISNVIVMCCIVEFGGLGTIFGPAAASFLLISLTYYLASLSAYKDIIIALIMLFTLLIWPTGMMGVASWFKSKYFSKKS